MHLDRKKLDKIESILGSKINPVFLITYSLTNLNHTQKTQFGYALKGRDGKSGMLKLVKGQPVGRNNIILPIKGLEEIKDFLATWKVKYQIKQFIEIKNGPA